MGHYTYRDYNFRYIYYFIFISLPPTLVSLPQTLFRLPLFLLAWTCLCQLVKLTPTSADSTKNHDFQHLSSIPGPIPRLPWLCKEAVSESWPILQNGGESRNTFFSFKTRSPGNFPVKRKSPSDYRRDQIRSKPPGKVMPTLVTME